MRYRACAMDLAERSEAGVASIKRMESLFGISYPTVKNRLNAIGSQLDRSFDAPVPSSRILEELELGEISVEEALERMS